MTYNILAIRAVSDPPDVLYPVLTDGAKGITVHAADGNARTKYSTTVLRVYEEAADGKQECLGSFPEGQGTLFVTDTRVIVMKHHFKMASGNSNWLGFGSAYLLSGVSAAIRTHNRALIGHFPLSCLKHVSAFIPSKRSHAPRIRMWITDRTEETARPVALDVSFKPGQDLQPVIRDLLTRYTAKWLWLVPRMTTPPSEALKARLEQLRANPDMKLEPDKWVRLTLPLSTPMRPQLLKEMGISSA